MMNIHMKDQIQTQIKINIRIKKASGARSQLCLLSSRTFRNNLEAWLPTSALRSLRKTVFGEMGFQRLMIEHITTRFKYDLKIQNGSQIRSHEENFQKKKGPWEKERSPTGKAEMKCVKHTKLNFNLAVSHLDRKESEDMEVECQRHS